eukprot:403361882
MHLRQGKQNPNQINYNQKAYSVERQNKSNNVATSKTIMKQSLINQQYQPQIPPTPVVNFQTQKSQNFPKFIKKQKLKSLAANLSSNLIVGNSMQIYGQNTNTNITDVRLPDISRCYVQQNENQESSNQKSETPMSKSKLQSSREFSINQEQQMKVLFPTENIPVDGRGWREETNHKSAICLLDLHFSLNAQDMQYHNLKKDCLINHNRGEGNITCKSGLIESLMDAPEFWINWAQQEYQKKFEITQDGPIGHDNQEIIQTKDKEYPISNIPKGIDAFYPKSFVLTSGKDFQEFQQYFWSINAESTVKQFIKSYEKLLDEPDKTKVEFVQEKLFVSLSIIKRKLQDLDQLIDQKGEIYNGFNVSNEECNFLSKIEYPKAYIDYVKKEDWYIRISREFSQFQIHKQTKNKKQSQQDPNEVISQLYQQCKNIIRQLRHHNPQTNLNGSQNIWIVKPGGLSRGRNIKIFDQFSEITQYTEIITALAKEEQQNVKSFGSKSWVVQKYQENPFLIKGRKFDIRVWVLVASWNPLQIFLYQECYIRFSAVDYDSQNIKNLFIHLTNNSIAKNCTNQKKEQKEKFPENMWSLKDFKEYLNSRQAKLFGESNTYNDVWNDKFKPQLEEIIKISLLSAWDKIEWRKNSIGLYGYDVILDSENKMWLLEINKCPTMEHSTKVTTDLVPKMINDMTKVLFDWRQDALSDTGDYHLIFESPFIKENQNLTQKQELIVQGKGLKKNI